MTSVGPGTQTGADQQSTADPNSVWSAGCSLNCGKFYNKMSRCAGVWGEGRRGVPVANVVVGVQMLLLELESFISNPEI